MPQTYHIPRSTAINGYGVPGIRIRILPGFPCIAGIMWKMRNISLFPPRLFNCLPLCIASSTSFGLSSDNVSAFVRRLTKHYAFSAFFAYSFFQSSGME